jgi:hypothetical protein
MLSNTNENYIDALINLGNNNYEKYYNLLLDINDIDAIRKIIDYNIKVKNYKYAVLSIKVLADKGDSRSIQTLGIYYKNKNDLINMNKYYIMGIDNDIDEMMWYNLTLLK